MGAAVGMGAAVSVGATTIGELAGTPSAPGQAGSPSAVNAAAEATGSTAGLVPASAEVRGLFGSLREGTAISTHWRIETVHAVRAGAVPVVMSTIYGGRFAVEIFRADPEGPQPIARAGELALHLVNRGDGSSRTAELAGLGVMALGRALDARIAAGAPVPAELETHRQRTARDPLGSFDVPLV